MSNSDTVETWFTLSAAQLIGNFCETLFFGVYIATCAFCARTLLLKGSGSEERWIHLHETRWMMVSTALILFIICTYDVATGLLHNFHAFIESSDPDQTFRKLADWINIVRTVDNVLVMIIWDFILMYRCWVVHGHRRLMMIPSIILYLGSIGVGCGLVTHDASLWIAFFGITTIQNIFTTSILIRRIWCVEKESERYILRSGSTSIHHQPHHLRKVIRVIAESGTVYTTMVFFTFACAAIGTNGLYPMSNMTIQAAGIAFNVILVRSSAGRDQRFMNFDQSERLAVRDNNVNGSTSLGSIRFAPNTESILHDVELNLRGVGVEDKQPSGIDTVHSRESDWQTPYREQLFLRDTM